MAGIEGGMRSGRDGYQAGRDLIINQPSQPAPPRIWNLPPRNAAFAGRKEQLTAIRTEFLSGKPVAVQALHGMGGVGKTQLAIEFAHSYSADYDIVWWLDSDSESTVVLAEKFAELAVRLDCAEAGTAPDVMGRAALSDLHYRDRWLIIFDNAEDPGALREWLPSGPGHVLITSRFSGWDEDAVPVRVDIFSRDESVGFLLARVPHLEAPEAAELAGELGDLPLALALAAAYLTETRLTVGQYMGRLRDYGTELLDECRLTTYRGTLKAVAALAYDLLHTTDEDAANLAVICAYLAPEPVPVDWLAAAAASRLPRRLSHRLADPRSREQLLSALTRGSLVRREEEGLTMHRLLQDILRTYPGPRKTRTARRVAETIVIANQPPLDQAPKEAWPTWARLLPHVLALLDPGGSSNWELRDVAARGAWYLTDRGNAKDALDLAAKLHEQWRQDLGADHPLALQIANARGRALRELGRYGDARVLDEETLASYQRLYGANHVGTLTAANSLAIDLRALGEHREAYELDKDTLDCRRRMLGDDHPRTLRSANNLAADLHALREFDAARVLNEDTLDRRRRVLGDDHPDTLISASNLADDLRALGNHCAARELDVDTLERRRRVLGEDHPLTRRLAEKVGRDRRGLQPDG
jgi:hypothetical protein